MILVDTNLLLYAADEHLAVIAIEHGLELQSHDAGFARFEGLRWADPLA